MCTLGPKAAPLPLHRQSEQLPIRKPAAIDTAEVLGSQRAENLARHDCAAAGSAVNINRALADDFRGVIQKGVDRNVSRSRNPAFGELARGSDVQNKILGTESAGRLVEFGHRECFHVSEASTIRNGSKRIISPSETRPRVARRLDPWFFLV